MCAYTNEIDLLFNRIGHDLLIGFAFTDHMRYVTPQVSFRGNGSMKLSRRRLIWTFGALRGPCELVLAGL
jgi:hypothetical protein